MRHTFFYYNLNHIKNYFGEYTSLLIKSWIDKNYKLIRAHSKLRFLKRRENQIFPAHLTQYNNKKFLFVHVRSHRKLERVLYNVKKKLLDIEILDLYRTIEYVTIEFSRGRGLARRFQGSRKSKLSTCYKKNRKMIYLNKSCAPYIL